MEESTAVERRFMDEMWNQGKLEVADELFAPDVVIHGFPVPAPGIEGVKQVIAASRAGLPDTHMTTEDLFAAGDKVVCRWVYRGTHQGKFMGLPPTGRQVTLTGIHIDHIVDGKIVERWVETNLAGMLQELATPVASGEPSFEND